MVRSLLLLLASLTAPAPRGPAQSCPDYGSVPVAATWTPAPVALGCPGALTWPQWHLFTPRYRALAPKTGYRPGATSLEPALLVPYACTGLLFAPVRLGRIRAMGFVVDTAQAICP
jgi:hypothetical protein